MTGLDGAWFGSTPSHFSGRSLCVSASVCAYCVYLICSYLVACLYVIINAIWTAEQKKREATSEKKVKRREKNPQPLNIWLHRKECERILFSLIHSINLLNCSLFFPIQFFFLSIFLNETQRVSKIEWIVWARFMCSCMLCRNEAAFVFLLLLLSTICAVPSCRLGCFCSPKRCD